MTDTSTRVGFRGMPPNSPAELTAIQDQIDVWVRQGVVQTRRLSQGSKVPKRTFYRVSHPWELKAPPDKRHVHDLRHDLKERDEEGKTLIYCTGCDYEVWRDVESLADPRVIRNENDGLGDPEDAR